MALTKEQEKAIDKIVLKSQDIYTLWYYIHPFLNHKRVDPKIRKKLIEIKKILDKIKLEKVIKR